MSRVGGGGSGETLKSFYDAAIGGMRSSKFDQRPGIFLPMSFPVAHRLFDLFVQHSKLRKMLFRALRKTLPKVNRSQKLMHTNIVRLLLHCLLAEL